MKLIAIWGNSGSGKSMLACALGNRLTKGGGNVLVISGDKVTPMLGVYCPFLETRKDFSVAGLFTYFVSSSSSLKDKIHIHENNNRLGFMALCTGENSMIHQLPWSSSAIGDLIGFIREQEYADYVIIDGTSDMLSDNLTLYALEHADNVLCVLSGDTRGVSFLLSQQPILRSGSFSQDKQIYILGDSFPYSPTRRFSSDYNTEYAIPHCKDAYNKYISGKLIQSLCNDDGVEFERELEKITERLCGSGK